MIEKFDPSLERIVHLSEAALKHFEKYIKEKNALGIAIGVTTTGCSGLAYDIKAVDQVPDNHSVFVEDKVNLYVDNSAVKYLQGLKIDYVKQPLGISQLVYQNPNESARCGCGESFTIDEDAK
ncbi:HesB/IscA family protein [Fangia hongkongensis]|uniref:HesB/IscA family protein n=1 Tax=Fangia hongkongensis TaxID=270495 RepID=UPI00035EC3D3|nr:iron-sulfur cluster assembly accessory protein [Fangia hongkongensis]MBK2125352.1 iron-sulfur cluster assembly accessory protein [Fangia hongkongensis]